MLPSDFSPERKARQRYLKREADMREPLYEVKVKVSTEPFFTVEVQFDSADFGNVLDRKAGTLTDSFVDTFARILSVGRFDIEERLRERRMFIKVAAKSSKEAIKIINTFLAQAKKVHAQQAR
jgi:imidazoleglycerol phosphate dehydratase HisB